MSRPHGALFGLNLFGKKSLEDPQEEMPKRPKLLEAWDFLIWKLRHAPRLRKFYNAFQGQDCFVIGNGPSLNKMDLSPLANFHTFGQNKIYLLSDRVDLNLSFLVSVNRFVIEQSREHFLQMKCPIFLSYTASRHTIPERPNIYRLHTQNVWSFYDDITHPICEGHTVTYVSLQLAYYMGFRRVVLIGVDHNFKQSGKAHEVQTYEGEDENHFHPDYFKGQKWQLADVYGSEVSYHLAQYHYLRDGRQILDATVDGKLQVFPKVKYDAILGSLTPKGK